jgi:DNA-binding CsgD family transcriptional regulator/tetratricopeptide (TPR) repeat protein
MVRVDETITLSGDDARSPYHRAMPRRLVSPTLVGRAPELNAISRALDVAATGMPMHLLIAGEAGVGKSRLVLEAAGLATARGMRVLQGGCADIGDGGVPYGPVVEALRTLERSLDAEALDTVLGPDRRELARLAPSLNPADVVATRTQTESHQARLLDAVLGLLQRLAETSPVLFVIEDLHWADPATRETIAFLIRHLRSDRVVLLMTYRADELHRRHPLLPWLAELERSGRVERIELRRLEPAETQALLTAIRGTPATKELADQIHRRSDGNPFFVEELLGAGEDAADGRLPQTLRDVLLARIVALPEPAQAVIGVAAVAGRRVDHDLLARVAAMDRPTLVDALWTAVGSQILVTRSTGDPGDGDYAFRHALLQEAAYEDLLPGERQRLHRDFAEALAERGPGSGAIAAGHWAELAYHWSAARDNRRAFEASIRAGESAAAAFAFADARRHDERALELWSSVDDPEEVAGIDRVALLDRAAIAAWLSGDVRRSVVLRREAVAALGPDADPIRAGTMLEQLGRALWTNSETEAALKYHEEAVAMMPADPPTAARARVLSGYGQILMLVDRWSESLQLCEQAVAMARAVGARQVEGHALNTLGLDRAVIGDCAGAMAPLEEAILIAREVANADDIGRGYVNLGEAKRYCGDIRGALETVRDGLVAADEVGVNWTYGTFIRSNGVAYAFDLGEWAEARRWAEESIATVPPGRAQRRYGLSRWLPLLVAQGDERAGALLDELRVLIEGFPVESQFHNPYRAAVAEAAMWRGEPDVALSSITEGLRETQDHEWQRYRVRLLRIGMRAAADLAEIARARRDATGEQAAIGSGEGLWAELLPVLDSTPHHDGDVIEDQAELTTIEAERARLLREPAVARWAEAAGRWRARENPYLVAYALWRAAEASLVDGDRTAAAEALAEAYRTATGLGARPLGAAIEALAARARLDLAVDDRTATPAGARTAAEDPFGLTRRERDVLPLLVKGRTNRQIAQELFISENTAGVHVSNILGKLGVATRTEAAGIAARLGLDDE